MAVCALCRCMYHAESGTENLFRALLTAEQSGSIMAFHCRQLPVSLLHTYTVRRKNVRRPKPKFARNEILILWCIIRPNVIRSFVTGTVTRDIACTVGNVMGKYEVFPQNWKYTTYCSATRGGLSLGHRKHVTDPQDTAGVGE